MKHGTAHARRSVYALQSVLCNVTSPVSCTESVRCTMPLLPIGITSFVLCVRPARTEQWVGAFAPMLHTHHVQRLLDLGCGTGNDVQRLAQRRDTVVGLDDSREAITQAARKAGSRTAFLVADMATPLPFMTGSVEAVMSNVALHMFDEARTWGLLTEVRRIVQPQGLLLFHVNALEDCPLWAKRTPASPSTRPP